jgi:hypothetical protein
VGKTRGLKIRVSVVRFRPLATNKLSPINQEGHIDLSIFVLALERRSEAA